MNTIQVTQTTIITDITSVADGTIAVRYEHHYLDVEGKNLGVRISGKYIAPGNDYSQEDAKVQAICAAVHTPEVIAEYQAQQLANQPQVTE